MQMSSTEAKWGSKSNFKKVYVGSYFAIAFSWCSHLISTARGVLSLLQNFNHAGPKKFKYFVIHASLTYLGVYNAVYILGHILSWLGMKYGRVKFDPFFLLWLYLN